MNEAFQAKAGLEPDLFPEDIPTYTGHYHKPHTVTNTNITYVGSPYQGRLSSGHDSQPACCLLMPLPKDPELCSRAQHVLCFVGSQLGAVSNSSPKCASA